MKNIIGADAVKLAGLQIDTLQKVRSGQITLGQWERFNKLCKGDREALFGDGKKQKSEEKKGAISISATDAGKMWKHDEDWLNDGLNSSYRVLLEK